MTRTEILQEIRDAPEKHRHTYDDLQKCCIVNGALDVGLVDAHSGLATFPGDTRGKCDVFDGPCACGAWH